MIEFRVLPDDHPDLQHSPLLRGVVLTLNYALEHGTIPLTKTKAFKRVFVHWAVEHFAWPDHDAEDMFRTTKRGAELAKLPGRLFAELIPYYVLRVDHSSYARIDERPFAKWDVWLNVINLEADYGSTERKLFTVFYGEEADWDNACWREMAAFSSYVLKPLEWAGLLVQQREETADGKHVHHVFKTPIWRSALKLDLDDQLRPMTQQ